MCTADSATIANSTIIVGSSDNPKALQLGPDGKLYASRFSISPATNYLAVINQPNLSGSLAGYNANGVALTGFPKNGLPNFITSYFKMRLPDLGADTILCSGDQLILDPGVSGDTYLWSTGATTPTIIISSPDTFWVQINECINNRDSMVVQYNAPPNVNLGADKTMCLGSDFIINGNTSGGISYLWSTGETTSTISILSPDTFWVQVTACGGVDSDTVIVTNSPPPIVNLGLDQSICSGSNMTLGAGDIGMSDYLWSTGETTSTVTISLPDTFWVRVTQCGNIVSDTIIVTNSPPPIVNLGLDQSICSGSNMTLDIGDIGMSDYLWSTGETTSTINISSPDTFWIRVIQCGNTVADTIIIYNYPPPLVNLGADQTICSGTSFILDADISGASSYLWSDGSSASSVSVSLQGSYWVEIDKCGIGKDTVIISHYPFLFIDLGSDTTLCIDPYLELNASVPNATYLWQDGSIDSLYKVVTPGAYRVSITDVNGCINSDSILINNNCPPNLYIENTFTPNGDNKNDFFTPTHTNMLPDEYSLTIFNRWGNIVFQTNDIHLAWDGTIKNGLKAEEGMYVYELKMVDIYYNKYDRRGFLKLMR